MFFQLIVRRYDFLPPTRPSPSGTRSFIASAILDRVLHHCTVINIKGESYRLKKRKEFMHQKQQIVNTLFKQGST